MRPLEIKLHRSATALTLAAARIYILGIWLVRILIDDTASISYLDPALYHPFGVMKLVPVSIISQLLTPAGLWGLSSWIIGILVLGILGIGNRQTVFITLSLLLITYLGLLKGFGGHVNHRELVLLYMTFALAILPCFDALALTPDRQRETREPGVYSASMIALCLILLFQYTAIGAARIFVGTPDVFNLEVMRGWILSRNLRPNPYEFELGRLALASPMLLWCALPISTVLELLAPIVIWSRPWVRGLLLLALAAFHGSILLLMNIPFFENILLLFLCTNYTPLLEKIFVKRDA